ncbi:MAG: bifunctional adenosylcobinamide kinase/adenosylcobinamide-phosphate guanylyltransferase [Proteobacteria bacterium]|nr:MAG: bifunctional adenosylcobinamide kinase/adenosylcobinamide-phosphate guanylyltransferase [Pseudomonadota bacterium]
MLKIDSNCRLILISGGARSGKSSTALELARKAGEERLFIATAQAFDQEMTDRIEQHKLERPDFQTLEKTADLGENFAEGKVWDAVVIDCLTLWLSSLIFSDKTDAECEASIYHDLSQLSQSCKTLILVSNEVGLGIVPEHALSRRFRDLNGRLQQGIGRSAKEVYFTVMGFRIPLHSFQAGQ